MTTAEATKESPRQPVHGSALSVRGLSHSYGALEALHEVTVEVAAGAICSILGPNGAGKSTLASCIAGTITTGPGTVLLDGTDISREAHFRRARRGIAYVPEEGAVFPALTVAENLVVGRRGLSGRQRRAVVDEAAAIFPFLGQRSGTRAGMLSGGEQQMLALSRFLVQKPALLVIDELSHGLAPAIVDQLFGVLAEFRGATTFVIIEQYVKRSQELADDVVVLSYGNVALATAAAAVSLDELEAAYEIQGRPADPAEPAPPAPGPIP
ncbi:MAG TPA: ATP-binding cassette domain-containing protein [Streptosporangiaceae bacterium]|jgi:branched-chain amino acid transport system ATP-binding protein